METGATRRRHIRKMGGKRISRSLGGNIVLYLFLILAAAFMGLPLLYTIVTAFKPVSELFLFPPRFFVSHPTLDNFAQMIDLAQQTWVPFSRYLFNSLFVACGGTALYILIASFAAFPLAKYRFKVLAVYNVIIVWAILFRPEVTGVPQYIILSNLSLVNTPVAVMLPVLGGSFGVFLMSQFMGTFPDATLEAARIDGASEYRILWSVVMPSIRPAWVTLIIFIFQQFWNINGVQYIYSENQKMLPTVLQQISAGGIFRAGAGSAVALILMIPPIVIFIISQSSVIETMAQSGIK